jgi:mannose-6-phosphate isomerase-like protein (cupin superfamily)
MDARAEPNIHFGRKADIVSQTLLADAAGDTGAHAIPLIDVNSLKEFIRLPGWRGRFFHSVHMTFAHYDFDEGASIHEHFHAEEEVYEVVEGKLEITVAGETYLAEPGLVAIVPADVAHSVKALTSGRVIIVGYPARPELG